MLDPWELRASGILKKGFSPTYFFSFFLLIEIWHCEVELSYSTNHGAHFCHLLSLSRSRWLLLYSAYLVKTCCTLGFHTANWSSSMMFTPCFPLWPFSMLRVLLHIGVYCVDQYIRFTLKPSISWIVTENNMIFAVPW